MMIIDWRENWLLLIAVPLLDPGETGTHPHNKTVKVLSSSRSKEPVLSLVTNEKGCTLAYNFYRTPFLKGRKKDAAPLPLLQVWTPANALKRHIQLNAAAKAQDLQVQ